MGRLIVSPPPHVLKLPPRTLRSARATTRLLADPLLPQYIPSTCLLRRVAEMRAVTYRLSLGLACLVWICIASTLCGCNQTSGYMNNQAGRAYYEQGNYTAARHSFERAMMDNPQRADYAFNVAASMKKQGDILAAERMYKHAMLLDPSHQPAYHGLAEMLKEQGRTAEAQDLLTAWNQTQPYDAESYVEMAWLQQEQGDLQGAEQSLTRALRMNPRHPTALAHLGRIYHQTGRTGEASGMYRRSLQMNPYQPEVQSSLAQLAEPNMPSASMQMATAMPHADPTLAPAQHVAYMPSAQSAGPHPSGVIPAQAVMMHPGQEWSSHPQMLGSPHVSSPYYGSMPAPQPVQMGAPMPVGNADPAHAPTVGSVPAVQPF
ncbi:MAG: hypothetical protein DWQ34_02075 [Planctomycetota bacterium]|nr:MAG: hypothetical protein DWQ29_23780 [Planctomycetota bacterium]REJ97463.1 MAG: hypothetical protein DWQ34_02075 [Planctomycetota bacterium]REK20985.1 MAG: hypothetical protein DWQ41_23365 [Planctomycetota bacterium]REK37233.1 MAG: hypothetical protein DWQ45_07215 [Planctomycetota bacterium]